MRQRLIALGVGLLFLSAVVGVAVVSRDGDGEALRKLPFGAAGAAGAERAMASDSMLARSVTYELAEGVSDPAKEAMAYELAEVQEAKVETLAEALGLDGDPKRDGEAWVVDDDERSLRVEPAGSWHLVRTGCGGPDGAVSSDGEVVCARPLSGGASGSSGASTASEPEPELEARRAEEQKVAGQTEPSSGGGADGSAGSGSSPDAPPPDLSCVMPECPEGQACIQSCPTPEPLPAPERPADLPSEDEARAIAERAFGRMGFDPDDGRVQVLDSFDTVSVTFDPEVGGAPVVGATQYLSIGPKGRIDYANGWILDADEIGSYPLAGIEKGVARLNESGGSGFGRDEPALGAPEPAIASCDADGAECLPPPDGGPIVPDEPVIVQLTGVEMAVLLVPSYRPGDSSYLVPAYRFATDEGGDVPVVAVTDELLAETAPTEPTPVPGERPTDPVDAASSCSGTAAGAAVSDQDSGGEPMIVSICVSDHEVAVGEVVTFQVTAHDGDAALLFGDCRRAPEAVFGDEEGAVPGGCIADCEAPKAGTTWDKQADKHAATYRHTYERAGTFTATFSFQSGDVCGQNPYASFGQATATITVTK